MENATPKLMGIDPHQPFYIAVVETFADGSVQVPEADSLIAAHADKQLVIRQADEDVGENGGRVYVYECTLVSVVEPA